MSKKQNGVLVTAPHFERDGRPSENSGGIPAAIVRATAISRGYHGKGHGAGPVPQVWRYRQGEGHRYGGLGTGRGSETLPQREFKRHLITEVLCVFP